jgi:hypothetical protein
MLGSLFQRRPKRPPAVSPGVGNPESTAPAEQAAATPGAAETVEAAREIAAKWKGGILDLLAELENNRRAARDASGDEPAALQTAAWDSNQRAARTLPQDLRADLESIYTDINLLNQLVWLSSEFRPASPALRARYVSLSLGIAHRLDEIVQSPRF